ncbi:unnamed protein product [Spirodela intermedia]|uniref:Uncharacterized protein n=2 Tax=Spirodela intermedia TaxID=51605 RepID=A0A7I8IRH9_SPIIN|nr:unnamed protein product [Spirodela intermedia]CAA6660573.1 unnamed protein product [Spirodela intermedia]CAA7396930.1 unnamed protein product [Spirodela intermedia]
MGRLASHSGARYPLVPLTLVSVRWRWSLGCTNLARPKSETLALKRWRPSEQNPISRTRFRWWVLLMVATSIRNCLSPCSIPSSCFTATTTLLASTPR